MLLGACKNRSERITGRVAGLAPVTGHDVNRSRSMFSFIKLTLSADASGSATTLLPRATCAEQVMPPTEMTATHAIVTTGAAFNIFCSITFQRSM